MSWRDFIIEPVDVWLFRDGRPFSAGSDVWARSLPMPSPFTLLGALRTFFLTQRGVSPKEFYEGRVDQEDLREEWGGPGANPGQLRLIGPFWCREERLYFPVPADVVRVGNKIRPLQPLKSNEAKLVEMNLPLDLNPLWVKAAGAIKSEGGYFSHTDFQNYLDLSDYSEDRLSSLEILPLQEFVERERRTGLKISQTRTAEEGFLYQVEFLRLRKGVQFCGSVWLPTGEQPQSGILFLGGERRMGFLKWDSLSKGAASALDTLRPANEGRQENQKRIKVILLSPAYFSEGWKPRDWSAIGLSNYRLVAAAIPRLIPLSMLGKKEGTIFQKRLYCVPPGSVYFFEKEQDGSKLPDAFTEDPFAEKGEREGRSPLKQLGFGLYATSTWNYV